MCLPLNYEVFAGNRADVSTVEEIVGKMEDRFGQAERILVMDRGMVSESNIAFLRQRRALYIVGTPKSQLRAFESELAEEENWTDVQNGVEARLVEHPDRDGSERFVLCRSNARAAKERAMHQRQMERLSEELIKVDRSLCRRPQADPEPIGRRIGRWQGRYPAASKQIEARLVYDDQGRACALRLSCPLREQGHLLLAKVAYLLRINCSDTDPGQAMALVYPTYPSRSILPQCQIGHWTATNLPPKDRPGGSPLADLLFEPCPVAFVGIMDVGQGTGSRGGKLVEAFKIIRSMDVIVPVKRGERVLDLRLRTVAKPNKDVEILLAHLGL